LALLLNAEQYGINIISDLRATWWLMLMFVHTTCINVNKIKNFTKKTIDISHCIYHLHVYAVFVYRALIIAMVVALLWILLMRWIAGPMVWLTIICFLGLFGFGRLKRRL
jgi:hypothetical protein